MTTSTHLDPDLLRDLQRGALRGAEARRLAEHLAGQCDVCDAFLVSRQEVDGLDGAVDQALLATGPAGEKGNDLEFTRIRRRLRGARPPRRVAFAAVAALALAVAGVGLVVGRGGELTGPAEWDGVKGAKATAEAAPARARLHFTVVAGRDGESAIERGVPGAVVGRDASLMFRIEVVTPGDLALIRLGGDGADDSGETIWQGSAAAAGPIDVEVDGQIGAYPLQGLSGKLRFGLLAAPHLEREVVDKIRRNYSKRKITIAEATDLAPGPFSMTFVDVTVR